MLTLIDLIHKAANTASVIVPAAQSAEGHERVWRREKNKVLPWIAGRKPPLRKVSAAREHLRSLSPNSIWYNRWRRILKAKRRSVPPHVIKQAFNYSDLGQPVRNAGTAAFNQAIIQPLVQRGLQTMPRGGGIGFGQQLTRGLQLQRGDRTRQQQQLRQQQQETKQRGFWGELTGKQPEDVGVWGRMRRAYHKATGRMGAMKWWQRPLWSAEMAAGSTPLGLGLTAASAPLFGDESVSGGPGFFQSLGTAAMAPVMAPVDVGEAAGAGYRALTHPSRIADPAQRRLMRFRQYLGQGQSVQAKAIFPDLYARHERGEL